jgi:F-type H+-transporting ATPase subunit delta
VTSAAPLDEALADIVRDRIGKVLGREAVLESTVDESLLGGLRLRVGDRMIDASVASRLGKMRDALRSSGGETVRSRMSELLVD